MMMKMLNLNYSHYEIEEIQNFYNDLKSGKEVFGFSYYADKIKD